MIYKPSGGSVPADPGFRDADLPMETFRDVDFSNCDFMNANLRVVAFINCKLDGANFTGADFQFARFIDTDIRKVDFGPIVYLGSFTVPSSDVVTLWGSIWGGYVIKYGREYLTSTDGASARQNFSRTIGSQTSNMVLNYMIMRYKRFMTRLEDAKSRID